MRLARVWNTNARVSMPTAVIAQPIRIAPASALAAMFCGREKIPPPIIEPTTNAINALRRSLLGDCDIAPSPFFGGGNCREVVT
ncbi:hypothetical protein D3C71_1941170 [compost metagenome]